MTHTIPATTFDQRLFQLVRTAAALADVKADVEANHDNNRWWPTTITDPRMRMAAAGWSTRISYNMISTYAAVIAAADAVPFDELTAMTDDDLTDLVIPLGLPRARITYLRSLAAFLTDLDSAGTDPLTMPVDDFITAFAGTVRQASYKVAQCAALYSRGYHSGIIPVDSGMVTKLAPVLGLTLPEHPRAHEQLRHALQQATAARAGEYRDLIVSNEYAITLPADTTPTWWLHLVLIYFKRRYLNRPPADLCMRRPVCATLLGCEHRTS